MPKTLKQLLATDRKLARGFQSVQDHTHYKMLGGKDSFTRLVVFDIDDTIFESVGTYEKDYDLKKFIKDNSLWNNLFLKKLPLFQKVNDFYLMKSYVVIQTARASRRWLKPLLKYRYGLLFHELIQRPVENDMSSNDLKREQLIQFIMNHKEFSGKYFHKIFVDDSKANRDSVESIGWSVYNSNYYNGVK